MAVGHEITGRFPALDVAGGNGPGGAGQLAFAGQEFLINGSAEDSKTLTPFLNLCELLACHFARQEEIFRLFAETFDHVLLGGVIFVTRRNSMAIDFER